MSEASLPRQPELQTGSWSALRSRGRLSGASHPWSSRGCWGVGGIRGTAGHGYQPPARAGGVSRGRDLPQPLCSGGLSHRAVQLMAREGEWERSLAVPRVQHRAASRGLSILPVPLPHGRPTSLCRNPKSGCALAASLSCEDGPIPGHARQTCPKSCTPWIALNPQDYLFCHIFLLHGLCRAGHRALRVSLDAESGCGRNWGSTGRAQGYQVTPAETLQVTQHRAWGYGHQDRQQEAPGETHQETAGAAGTHTVWAASSGKSPTLLKSLFLI